MSRLDSCLASKFMLANHNTIHPIASRLNWVRNFAVTRKESQSCKDQTIYVPNSIGNDGGASFLQGFSSSYPGCMRIMEKAIVTEGRKAIDAGAFYYKGLGHGFYVAGDAVAEYLGSRAKILETSEEILRVAKKLGHGDKMIGEIVDKAIAKGGDVVPLLKTIEKPLTDPQHNENVNPITQPEHVKRVRQWLELDCKIDDYFEHEFMTAEAIRAVKVVKAGMSDGFIRLYLGGAAELVHASKVLDNLPTENSSQKIGVQLLQDALKMPMFTIASHAGFEGSAIIEKLLKHDNYDLDLGFDYFSGEFITDYYPESMIPFFSFDCELAYMMRMADKGQLLPPDDIGLCSNPLTFLRRGIRY